MLRGAEQSKESPNDNQRVIEDLMSGDDARIRTLYHEFFPVVKHLVLNNNGSLEDAEDVYQDSLVIIFRKVRKSDLKLQCSFSTYLFSVAKHLWLQKLRARKVQLNNLGALSEPEDPWPRDEWEEEEKMRLYREHFRKLKPDCRKVIRMMLEKKSLDEIAEKMGFKNSNYAKTKKFNCKEILRKKIMNDPRYKSLFE